MESQAASGEPAPAGGPSGKQTRPAIPPQIRRAGRGQPRPTRLRPLVSGVRGQWRGLEQRPEFLCPHSSVGHLPKRTDSGMGTKEFNWNSPHVPRFRKGKPGCLQLMPFLNDHRRMGDNLLRVNPVQAPCREQRSDHATIALWEWVSFHREFFDHCFDQRRVHFRRRAAGCLAARPSFFPARRCSRRWNISASRVPP